jgi:NADPH:quinone reductase-like Zn-dependent oxidoreductase
LEALREEVAMKAVQVVKYGDAVEGVELREVPEPDTPKPGEVLVGVEFSPINFNDLMVVWGIYSWRPELPATMGNEGAGKVVAVGGGVTAVKVGDRVILPFTVRKWQQRVLVPAEELIVVPPDADPQQAAMMAINPVTAALLLDQYVDLEPAMPSPTTLRPRDSPSGWEPSPKSVACEPSGWCAAASTSSASRRVVARSSWSTTRR